MPLPFLIMCGLPYSGKSFLAKQIAQNYDYDIVSVDEILTQQGYSWDHFDQIGDGGWQNIFDTVDNQITNIISINKKVVYDSANQDKASRDKYRSVANRLKTPYKIIWLDTPIEVITERREQNYLRQERFHIPDNLFVSAIKTYHPPLDEPDVIRISPEDDIENLLRRVVM